MLEDNRERHVSGAAMAKAIGVSRNAVWKAVKALRAEGYAIDAVTNRGYALSQENDLLSPQGIERFLPDNRAFAVTVRKRVDSTNAEARRRALEGAAEGTVVVAEEQTAGKGRPGKTFFSPAATGLYLSIVLRPTLAADRGQFITCAAAVACAQAIEQVTGAESLIKWVNDIYCDGRKVAGILTEMSADLDQLHWAVAGIGLNANWRDIPQDIAQRATSLAEAGGAPVDRAALIARVLDALEADEGLLSDPPRLLERLRAHSVTLGRPVRVAGVEETFTGLAEAMDEEGALLVRRQDGTLSRVLAGDVSVRGLMGYAK
ncbi:MAG: biotin--[acetyl-CoA-carboxylase] ligase [Eggerthellaceae bacterium]